MTEIVTVTSRLHGERTFHLSKCSHSGGWMGPKPPSGVDRRRFYPNPPFRPLCQLWPATDITPLGLPPLCAQQRT